MDWKDVKKRITQFPKAIQDRILTCPKCSKKMSFFEAKKCLRCKCGYKAEDFMVHLKPDGSISAIGFLDEA